MVAELFVTGDREFQTSGAVILPLYVLNYFLFTVKLHGDCVPIRAARSYRSVCQSVPRTVVCHHCCYGQLVTIHWRQIGPPWRTGFPSIHPSSIDCVLSTPLYLQKGQTVYFTPHSLQCTGSYWQPLSMLQSTVTLKALLQWCSRSIKTVTPHWGSFLIQRWQYINSLGVWDRGL